MEEKTFLSEGGTTVTSARFIVPSQTFAMSGITSVKAFEEKPSRTIPALLVVFGVLCLFGGKDMFVLAFILIVIGGGWLASLKSKFHVQLTTASGEAKALTSDNKQWIEKVIAALNESIVHRG